jgi:UDP:flavonoid glycosyltransferase YjiC (YdhE family)
MKVLYITPSAAGLLNHGVALSKVFQDWGWDVAWITGPEAQAHLQHLRFTYPVYFLNSHSLDFERGKPGRLTHLAQICQPSYVRRALRDELSIIERFRPSVIIVKNFWTVPLSSRITGIPWITYYTGGILDYHDETNPLVQITKSEYTDAIQQVAYEFGLTESVGAVPYNLKSPYLNIVRGFPGIDSSRDIPPDVRFCGALTYDGSDVIRYDTRHEENYDVYVTSGTMVGPGARMGLLFRSLEFSGLRALLSIPDRLAHQGPSSSDRITITSYYPNTLAMHRSKIVFHHGGYGTFLEACVAGIPQLVYPDNLRSSNQLRIGEVVEMRGLGKSVQHEDPELLARYLLLLLRDQRFRQGAESIRRQIAVQAKPLLYELKQALTNL